MPTFGVRFPDGRFGAFSTVVDAFVMFGNIFELEEYFAESIGKENAIDKVISAYADKFLWQPWEDDEGDRLNRFKYALKCLALNKSKLDIAAELADLKLPPEWEAYTWQKYEEMLEERRKENGSIT